MDYTQPNWINSYLTPDEYVLWNGRPGKGNLLTKQDVFMVPFSIMWCGFAIIWETTVLMASTPLLFKLWGIPFVCVGLYMVFGRFIMKSYMRKETVYVITNKRIFSCLKNRVDTIDYPIYPTKSLTRHPNGYGTICFSLSSQPNPIFYMPGRFSNQNYFELDNIPDVDRVLQILSTQ